MFCMQKTIDMSYVCSVCLSIFCQVRFELATEGASTYGTILHEVVKCICSCSTSMVVFGHKTSRPACRLSVCKSVRSTSISYDNRERITPLLKPTREFHDLHRNHHGKLVHRTFWVTLNRSEKSNRGTWSVQPIEIDAHACIWSSVEHTNQRTCPGQVQRSDVQKTNASTTVCLMC